MSIKIVQINTGVSDSSTGRIADRINSFARKKGWKTYFVYSGRLKAKSESNLIPVGGWIDSIAHLVYTRLFDKHGLASRISTYWLIRKLRNLKPDIIHLHNLHGYYINFKLLFTFLAEEKIPVIWTFHDFWPITGHCTHFAFIGCERWKNQCFDCPSKKTYPESFVLDNSEFNYRIKNTYFNSIEDLTIVPVSHWVESYIGQSFVKNQRIQVIYNGICTDKFRVKFVPKSLIGVDQNTTVLLGVSSHWVERKGFFDFLSIARMLPEQYIILLVGLSSNQIKKLPSNVIGVEQVSNNKGLEDYYNLSDIYLNLSYLDTFGLTTIEAMACGKPCIAYNINANPEIIIEGKTGYLVEKGNLNQIIETIKKIETKNINFSEHCRKHVESHFSNQIQVENYFNLYEKVLIENQVYEA